MLISPFKAPVRARGAGVYGNLKSSRCYGYMSIPTTLGAR